MSKRYGNNGHLIVQCAKCHKEFAPSAKSTAKYGENGPKESWLCFDCWKESLAVQGKWIEKFEVSK